MIRWPLDAVELRQSSHISPLTLFSFVVCFVLHVLALGGSRSFDTIICQAAADVGTGKRVTVTVAGQQVVSTPLLSFPAPVITRLQGGGTCDLLGDVTECPIDGNVYLNVTGLYFGAVGVPVNVTVQVHMLVRNVV